MPHANSNSSSGQRLFVFRLRENEILASFPAQEKRKRISYAHCSGQQPDGVGFRDGCDGEPKRAICSDNIPNWRRSGH